MDSQTERLRQLGCETVPDSDALEVMNGPEDGRWFHLDAGNHWMIGRAATAAIPLLLDSSVSREHARLSREGGRYWIEDLESTHGITRNGQILTERTELDYGDKILVGSTLLELRRGRHGTGDGHRGPG